MCLPGYVDRRPVWCLVEHVRPSVLTYNVSSNPLQKSLGVFKGYLTPCMHAVLFSVDPPEIA